MTTAVDRNRFTCHPADATEADVLVHVHHGATEDADHSCSLCPLGLRGDTAASHLVPRRDPDHRDVDGLRTSNVNMKTIGPARISSAAACLTFPPEPQRTPTPRLPLYPLSLRGDTAVSYLVPRRDR